MHVLRKDGSAPDAEVIASVIEQSLEDDKAVDPVRLDLSGKTSIADYMIIASGNSARQVSAMADHVVQKLKSEGLRPKTEGTDNNDWVLIDAGDVIVHLFRPEVREFYRVEQMWAIPNDEAGESPADVN